MRKLSILCSALMFCLLASFSSLAGNASAHVRNDRSNSTSIHRCDNPCHENNDNNIWSKRGPRGPVGPRGFTGFQGPAGPAGPTGFTGTQGPAGPIGLTGARGPAGPAGPIGLPGPAGAPGATGPIGLPGPAGAPGPIGPIGLTGPTGAPGATGPIGLPGPAGAPGATGPIGLTGPTGAPGATGPAGGISDFADFFALMPPNNSAKVFPGTDVSFPQNGPTSGTAITRINAVAFNLSTIGTYQILSQVSVTEPGQLILTLNGANLAYTVVGRATGTSQIVEMALVTTSAINSILTVRNPTGYPTALTITPLAGGTRPVSAHLVITRLR